MAAAYDCVILDWMLPKKDGITVLREIRQSGSSVPVLMLSAKGTVFYVTLPEENSLFFSAKCGMMFR